MSIPISLVYVSRLTMEFRQVLGWENGVTALLLGCTVLAV